MNQFKCRGKNQGLLLSLENPRVIKHVDQQGLKWM